MTTIRIMWHRWRMKVIRRKLSAYSVSPAMQWGPIDDLQRLSKALVYHQGMINLLSDLA
jgi:hypothetical protein